MLYGGKKILISPEDWDDEDVRPDDDDEDNAYVVQFWVNPYSDDENAIEVMANSCEEQMPVWIAEKVAKAIATLSRWPTTKDGKKEIARLRACHERYEDEREAKRAAKQAAPTGSVEK